MMRIKDMVGAAVVFAACSITLNQTAATTAYFQGLGDLPGGLYLSEVGVISSNGEVVLGSSRDASGSQKFIWTMSGGMTPFEIPLETPYTGATIWNFSGDGSVFVGTGTGAAGNEAIRWSASDGMTGLGDLPGGDDVSYASATSADGSVVVGRSGVASIIIGSDTTYPYEPFIWNASDGMVGLGSFIGEPVGGEASDVSADGTVVVGHSTVVLSPGQPWASQEYEAFRWTETSGMQRLGFEFASAVSSDGSTVVGYTSDDLGHYSGYYWTEGTGPVQFTGPDDPLTLVWPQDVSADGSVIIGISFNGPPSALIWDEVHGTRNLMDVLVNDFGLDLTGWELSFANAISDDGLTIVGYGTNPDGNTEAFIAHLPEPGALSLLVAGALSTLIRRR